MGTIMDYSDLGALRTDYYGRASKSGPPGLAAVISLHTDRRMRSCKKDFNDRQKLYH